MPFTIKHDWHKKGMAICRKKVKSEKEKIGLPWQYGPTLKTKKYAPEKQFIVNPLYTNIRKNSL